MMFSTTLLTLLGLSSMMVDAQQHVPRRRHHAKKSTVGGAVSPRAVGGPAAAAAAGNSLEKRTFSDCRFTYYIVDVGLGSCGNLNTNEDYTVALSSINYEAFGSSYPSPVCGKMISITVNGKTTTAKIQDECPGCPENGLDMSPGLFTYFADESVGVLSGSWYYLDDSSAATTTSATFTAAKTTSTYVAPTTSSTSVYVAPTTSTTSVATTSSAPVFVAAAVVTTSSSSSVVVPPTTSTYVAPTTTSSSTFVAPTTTSSSVAVVPTTTSVAAPAAVTTSAAAVVAPAAVTTSAAAPAAVTTAVVAPFVAPTPVNCSSVIFNNIALYNGTSALFNGSVNSTSLYNQVQLVNNTSSYCYNGSLFTISNHTFSAFTIPTNFTARPAYYSGNWSVPSNSSDYLAAILIAGSNETSLTNTSSFPAVASYAPATVALASSSGEEEDLPWCDEVEGSE